MDLNEKRQRIYDWIDANIRDDSEPAKAAKYAILGKSHLWRPLVAIGAAEIYGAEFERALPIAVAQEFIHTSTLILDDLPSMDNADMRRGRESCWKKYGVASAELASFYLIAQSILAATRSGLSSEQIRDILDENALAANKMIAGQDMDLRQTDLRSVEQIVNGLYALKSGALFGSAATTGGIVGKADKKDITHLRAFGHYLGVAYQLRDDLCDAYGDEKELGKPVKKDNEKRTALALLGPQKTIAMKKVFEEMALDQLRMTERNGKSLEKILREMSNLKIIIQDVTT